MSERLTVGDLGSDGGEVAPCECEPDHALASLVALDRPQRGQPLLVRDVVASPSGAGGETDRLAVLARLGVRSLISVPLRARETNVGVLTLARGPGRHPYSDGDLSLAEEFGGRVAEAVINARSYRREQATAEALARGLLPGRLPAIPGVEVAAHYRATGDVGGDFYDCIPRGDGRWLVVVGDVCGRGIQAASMTGLTRHTIRAAALHAASPAAVLHDLNRLLVDAAGGEVVPSADLPWEPDIGPTFCTVCVAEVTLIPAGARVMMSSGGHPLPFVVRADGRVDEIGRRGSLVGVLADLDVTEEVVDLGPGDALVLFTDGITERRRKGRLFEDDLPATLHRAAGGSADEIAGWAGAERLGVLVDGSRRRHRRAGPRHPAPG
ncbi:MAG: SpoIIE family protein phosphatase [Actinomycetota bacterium]|nr:SpoIIE family protein phosphatase [Actinomycetota bacterium]